MMKKNNTWPIWVFFFISAAVLVNNTHLAAATYTVTVTGAAKQGSVPHFWSECVGTGTMAYCLKTEWQTAAKIGAEEAGFKRVRGHGILMGWDNNDKVGIFHWNGAGAPVYTWETFDKIYDFIVKTCKMQPVVELSFMPKDPQTSNQTSNPRDYDVWRDLIKAIISHCIERYGLEEVRQWYWKVWNEYDYSGFWHSDNAAADYYNLYKYAAEGAKSAVKILPIKARLHHPILRDANKFIPSSPPQQQKLL
jgi:xylan 1,4-beta-xylosidase